MHPLHHLTEHQAASHHGRYAVAYVLRSLVTAVKSTHQLVTQIATAEVPPIANEPPSPAQALHTGDRSGDVGGDALAEPP